MQIPQGHLGQILVAFLSDGLREALGGDTQITCGILALWLESSGGDLQETWGQDLEAMCKVLGGKPMHITWRSRQISWGVLMEICKMLG